MGKKNQKEMELRNVANIILSANDYRSMIQGLNGYRMGLTNKYKYLDLDKLPAGKRINTWKQLVELYK